MFNSYSCSRFSLVLVVHGSCLYLAKMSTVRGFVFIFALSCSSSCYCPRFCSFSGKCSYSRVRVCVCFFLFLFVKNEHQNDEHRFFFALSCSSFCSLYFSVILFSLLLVPKENIENRFIFAFFPNSDTRRTSSFDAPSKVYSEKHMRKYAPKNLSKVCVELIPFTPLSLPNYTYQVPRALSHHEYS